jgi:hypothetical protein
MEPETVGLEVQLAEARRTISSDGYPMSIGELTNMYKSGELIVRPEFQRFFRWTSLQKSRLIESVLLGIPIPSIFVAQTDDGKWELIDGLQRVSTLLQLQGELVTGEGKKMAPLVLQATSYLPALEGKVWESTDPSESLSEAQRLDIKRSKLDIKIIKRESTPATKYDLFQRLNNYGTPLTSQELRSSLLVAVSSDFFAWMERMASHPAFVESMLLSDRLLEERFDLELVTRFMVLHNRPANRFTLTLLRDLPRLLDDEIVKMATLPQSAIAQLEHVFESTFVFINQNGGPDVFRKWDPQRSQFRGSFLSTSFEVFALGVGYQIANNKPYQQDLLAVVKEFWSRPEMQSGFATGRSTEARLAEFVPLGRGITVGK